MVPGRPGCQADLEALSSSRDQHRQAIAVVGLACRLPEAEDPRALWQILADGRDVVTEIPANRWNLDEVFHPDAANRGTIATRFGSFLRQIDGFDWRTFRILPREARFMDPQHRLLLELAWEALEDAGIPFERIARTRTGVYVGIKWNDYAKLQALRPSGIDSFSVVGGDLALAANRISYQFDLVGPSMALDVGCASSLVATHLGCRAILSGETDCAIVGGVNLMLALDSFISASRANLLSPDGHCKMFDASADGYVRAEGGVVIVLKSLERALRDGDRIWGVIRGSAALHNGRTEWIMASSPEGQRRLMEEALTGTGIDPAAVDYVELHGTGTRKGDPIEAKAVGSVYGGAARARPLLVGSVKTNLGHTEAAAGLAGLAKVLVSIERGELPKNLHFETPNPDIPFESLGLEVITERRPWPVPRLAAINSLSFGGSNAHVIVEGPPEVGPSAGTAARPRCEEQPTLLVLSARSEPALRVQAARFAQFLTCDNPCLQDVVWTAAVRRTHHDQRLAVVGVRADDLARRLTAFAEANDADGVVHGASSGAVRPIFVFSGQGTTWQGMARVLLAREPVFRDALVACEAHLRKHVSWSLVAELELGEGAFRLDRTELAQPAIFAIQVALAVLWRSWGVLPAAIVGHSVGEIAAAHVAGVLTAEDAAEIACERGRLMASAAGRGRMVQVSAPANALESRLARFEGRVTIGAYNGPNDTVLSGDRDAIDSMVNELREAGLTCAPLPGDYAFHSAHLDVLVKPLMEALRHIRTVPPAVPLYSTLTGAAYREDDFGPAYWGRQMREPVQLWKVTDHLVADGHDTFVEIGPAAVLGESLKAALQERGRTGAVLASMRRGRPDRQVLLRSAAMLHVRGARLDFEHVLAEGGRPVALPGYPWQRERLWFDSSRPVTTHPLLGAHVRSASLGTHTWEATIDPQELAWLSDHAVNGAAVLPASAYIEVVIAAVREACGWTRCRLVDIAFARALEVAGPTRLRLVLTPVGDGSFAFDMYARPVTSEVGTGEWLRRAGGRVALLDDEATESLDIAATRARLPEELSDADCYATLTMSGMDFGPAFQGIVSAWRDDREVLAHVAPPKEIAGELAQYQHHPALLDACMHATPLVVRAPERRGASSSSARGKGCMPTMIKEIRVLGPASTPLWTRVRKLNATRTEPSRRDHVDIEVFDGEGRAVMVARDLVLQWLEPTVDNARAAHEWCYRVDFRELPTGEPQTRRHPDAVVPWLIITDRGGVGAALVVQLRARGHVASLVAPEKATVDLDATKIVHLGALDAPRFDTAAGPDLGAILRLTCGSVVELAQKLGRADRQSQTVWLVTRGARRVDRARESASPVQAAIWGLGRAMAQELPSAWGGLVDLDPAMSTEHSAAELARYLCEPIAGEDVAIRNGKLHVARLVREPLPAREPIAIRGDGAYLVTGGLGGLGHVVARWLVHNGARTIILMGRSPLPARTAWDSLEPSSRAARHVRQVRELEMAGATVHIATVDVGRRELLERWLSEHCARHAAPIRGVVHCAGVVSFQPLAHMSVDSLDDILAAKALGAAWLHALVPSASLDFFALYSSAASVLDSPMLGHYAAANAFLDALAHVRRHEQLPAVSINWGPWSEAGMAMAAGDRGPATLHGVDLIDADTGMDLFGRILSSDESQIAVLPMDWAAWSATHPAAAAVPLLSECMSGVSRSSPPAPSPAVPAAQPAPRNGGGWTEDMVRDAVRVEVARALFLDDPDAVDIDRPLKEFGLDSLMAIELVNALGKRVHATLPSTLAFDSPTPRELADHLLTRLAASSTPSAGTAPEVPAAGAVRADHNGHGAKTQTARSDDARLLGLSLGQERLHLVSRLAPDTCQYVEFFALQVTGALDVELLRRCLAVLVNRHETLRSAFPEVAMFPDRTETPRALVAPDGPVDLEVVDANARLLEALGRPFHLSRGPLWRAVVVTWGEGRHTLAFAKHHIITDAISIGIFVDELSRLYRSQADVGVLPALHSQYSDFVRAERRRVADEGYQASVGWWREHLLGLGRLELRPAGRTATALGRDDCAPDAVPVRLSHALGQAIRDFARREGCTSFEILLAAWACALHRYTAQVDFAVGTMVAHDRRDHAGVLGFFVNTVVLRCDLSGRPTFLELVRRMGETVRTALRHGEVDFGDVVRAHRDEHRQDQSALVQATLNLVPAFPPLGGDHGAGWAWDNELTMPARPAKFELALELVEAATGLHGKLEYATDLFDRETAVAMTSHFVVLLEGGLAAPDARIGTLPLLTAAERQRLLIEWNATAETIPDTCIHHRFEAQAESTPDAVAVIFEGEELSYGELDARANRLAHHLRSLGVGPEARVAVCLRRSAQTIVALLGVLKAGGAYIPLDSAHPRERIAFMLEDAAPVALITETALASRLPEAAGHRVWVDADAEAIAACSSARVRHGSAQPDGSAYVIYTSGSTGRPKAVVGLHRGAMNFLSWLWKTLPFEKGEVCAQKTSLSFVDAFVEIFGPLLRGVPLVVVPDEEVKDPERLIELLAAHRVTRLVLVPSLLRVMLDVNANFAARLSRLKYWLLSGETLPDALLERLHSELPAAIVLNTYGSSEVSANATSYTCRTGAPASIGRPLDNTRVYVLDPGLQPVPVGVPGELYVGGVGLARGYLSQPALTAERFVPDPFSQRGGERLYRMGDRVRWLPDGNLEFLGRTDGQVKIRGYRIELGEVELAVASHPAVRSSVVLVREDQPGDSRLVAYVVFREAPVPSDTALRDHVSTRLPVYMVPSAFVALPALPLTASGKVDRRALAARRAPRPIPPAECVPLEGDVEEALAEIWKDVLNVAAVDGRRPFFEQGGNSLLLVRIHQRIRSELRVDLPVGELFGHPTIEALAKRIRNPPRTPSLHRTSASPGRAASPPEIAPAASMSAEALRRLIDEKHAETSADVSNER